MKKIAIAFLLLLAGCASENPRVEVLVEDLRVPWAIAFFDDDSFLFTERDTGRIYHYSEGKAQHIGSLPAKPAGEAGLLGIAIDPDFEQNKLVYAYYTYKEDGKNLNRVSRLTYDGQLKNEKILLDAIPGAVYHDGGRIDFGPDNKIYITTGDAGERILAQDLDSVAGKILRMNPDGSVPEDNPFPNSLVYSYGYRNPQGLAWQDDTLFAPEHGWKKNDEINIIVPGENYGWPLAECTAHEGYTAPIRCFDEWTLAPGGATFDEQGNLYVAGLRGKQIRKFALRDGAVVSEEVFLEGLGRMREVKHHKGYLYITTSNMDGRGVPHLRDDKIIRISLP